MKKWVKCSPDDELVPGQELRYKNGSTRGSFKQWGNHQGQMPSMYPTKELKDFICVGRDFCRTVNWLRREDEGRPRIGTINTITGKRVVKRYNTNEH